MNAHRIALSALFVSLLSAGALAGCEGGAGEPAVGSGAQAEVHGTYGYVMLDEKVTAAAPDVAARPAEVAGRLAPELIRDTVRAGFGELHACDHAAREGGGTVAVTVSFVIDGSGAVRGAKTSEARGADAAMQACVREAIEDMRFPRSSGGDVEVACPLVF